MAHDKSDCRGNPGEHLRWAYGNLSGVLAASDIPDWARPFLDGVLQDIRRARGEL